MVPPKGVLDLEANADRYRARIHLLPDSFAMCSDAGMTDAPTELIATLYHHLRTEAKKQRKTDPQAAQREAFRRLQEQENSRFSIYPPGWREG